MIITAGSAIQVSNNYTFKYDENAQQDSKSECEIRNLNSIHVGDYENMLFKKALVRTQIPMIVVATFKKIDLAIKINKCHFVFDKKDQWESLLNDRCIAFCKGCTNSEVGRLEEILTNMGLIVTTSPRGNYMTVPGKTGLFHEKFHDEEILQKELEYEDK